MRRGNFIETFPVTSAILILCLGLFGLEVYSSFRLADSRDLKALAKCILDPDLEVLFALGGNSLAFVREGEVWRLLSSVFLHGGIIHIAFNLFVLVDLGRICEPLLGRERFTVVFVASGIGGSLASAAWSSLWRGPHAFHLSIGASGAVMGLIGLLLAFGIRHRDRDLRDQILRWVIYIAVLGFLIPGIDNAAHAGGLIAGAVFGLFTPRYVTSGSSIRWRIPFGIAALAAAASIAIALREFFRWDFR